MPGRQNKEIEISNMCLSKTEQQCFGWIMKETAKKKQSNDIHIFLFFQVFQCCTQNSSLVPEKPRKKGKKTSGEMGLKIKRGRRKMQWRRERRIKKIQDILEVCTHTYTQIERKQSVTGANDQCIYSIITSQRNKQRYSLYLKAATTIYRFCLYISVPVSKHLRVYVCVCVSVLAHARVLHKKNWSTVVDCTLQVLRQKRDGSEPQTPKVLDHGSSRRTSKWIAPSPIP